MQIREDMAQSGAGRPAKPRIVTTPPPINVWPANYLKCPQGQSPRCTPLDHRSPAGTLAALHHGLAQRFAGTQATAMQGRA